eukprot:CAMPEP_0176480098 /NCGR_PEP_ID=MMETSP0200_2-20121128/2095_1 /TAXON_ID=947934 /ORGANISM="Chaetoceros sp., Strain GSL56" /LENGTH=702 /DNA_ID=CAMNT_0017876193 /DNA_START=85 /DNA_END=2193 /DNA_ORIENTATION=-
MKNAKAFVRQMSLNLNRRVSSRFRYIGQSIGTSTKDISGDFYEQTRLRQHHSCVRQIRCFSKLRGDTSFGDILNQELLTPDLDDVQNFKTSEDMDFYDPLTVNYYPAQEDEDENEEIEVARRQAIRDEIDSRTGRLWKDRWELTDEDWSSGKSFDDLPVWTEELCSRVSRERVVVYPDGVPTLSKLSSLALPPPSLPPPALGNPKPYVKHRKKIIFDAIYARVQQFAEPHVEKILAMDDWDAKQKAVDDLFEQVHDELKKADNDDDDYVQIVLGSQPNFPLLVEQALEKYLRKVVHDEKASFQVESKAGSQDEEEKKVLDETAVPIFMDLMKAKDPSLDEKGIPKILHPLSSHKRDGSGRMVEEWELAANVKTRRIMIRQCTRDIAHALDQCTGSRVFVTGRKGAGKTAALAGIVASARESGHIVLYLPDGDRLRKHGFYVEVNNHVQGAQEKLFDIPMLSKEVCSQLHQSHSKDMDGLTVEKETLEKFMSKDQLKKLDGFKEYAQPDGSMLISDLLKIGGENVALAAGCYSAAIDTLMAQTSKPFTVVMDQFNCYYDYGHYFHGEYDKLAKKAIPLDKITLFRPLIQAVGVIKTDDEELLPIEPKPIKRGGIVVGITQSHAVANRFTTELTSAIKESNAKVVDVPQYSAIEVDHILANFEIIGIGRLRFDRGETVMNKQEVAYLRMVSGGLGQSLLDACII